MKKEKVLAAGLAVTVALGALTLPASAAMVMEDGTKESTYSVASEGPSERLLRNYKTLFSVGNKSVYGYARPTVEIAGKRLSVNGLFINGEAYIPFRAAASTLDGSSYSYNSKDRSSVMNAGGLNMKAGDGCYTIYANDRALFSEHPTVIMSDGRMYIPAEQFAKAAGMSLSVTDGRISFKGRFTPLAHASKFYREDEVLWLARIIHAESRGEPLLGKIAVGDVVLNRVRSAYYPNTIYGVIFDRKYGVQFSPILDGSIYNTPDFNSILAAKICLDGYMISKDVFFFLEPTHSTSSWIPREREYLFTIGHHDFYK